MVFEQTRKKFDTMLNDRVEAPIRTAVVISVAAFAIAVIALIVAVSHAG